MILEYFNVTLESWANFVNRVGLKYMHYKSILK